MASPPASQAAPYSPAAGPSPRRDRLRLYWPVGLAAAAVCVLAGVYVGWQADRDQVDRAVLETFIVGVPVAVGFYAIRYEHYRRFGFMLMGAGLLWSLTALASSPHSVPYSFGRVVAWLVFPLLVYLMLAFPEGRLASTTPRLLFGSVTGLIVVLYIGSALFVDAYPAHTPWASCDADCPPNAFMVVAHQPAVMDDVVLPLREGLGVLLLVGVTWLLLRRMGTASRLRRRTIGPVTVMSLAWLVTLVAYLVARRADSDTGVIETVGRVWSLCVPGIAAAFLVGMLRRGIVMGEVLQFLAVTLSRPRDAPELRDAVSRALRDPQLDVLVPADDGIWHGVDGQPAVLEERAEGRAVTVIGDPGDPDLALVHDSGLCDDGELLDAVTALVGAWLEQERLELGLATSRTELADSRERIASVADEERARIERDLHDGAQQRLIMMRIKLSVAEELLRSDAEAGAEAVHELGDQIDLTVEELRALAHGVYPSLLSDRGLADALRSVVLDSPLPVHLEVSDVTRHPVGIETAVYFVCLEALQNAIKHADGASGLWIRLRQEEDVLRAEICDDGPGFAPGSQGNGGLRNMHDRVEAVGGRLVIDGMAGTGTLVRFSVPVAAGTVRPSSGPAPGLRTPPPAAP